MKSIRVLCVILMLMLIAAGCRKKPTETITPLHQAAQAGDIEKSEYSFQKAPTSMQRPKEDGLIGTTHMLETIWTLWKFCVSMWLRNNSMLGMAIFLLEPFSSIEKCQKI